MLFGELLLLINPAPKIHSYGIIDIIMRCAAEDRRKWRKETNLIREKREEEWKMRRGARSRTGGRGSPGEMDRNETIEQTVSSNQRKTLV